MAAAAILDIGKCPWLRIR